jgi:5-methylcytosine-specific restriction endonuclease McrA
VRFGKRAARRRAEDRRRGLQPSYSFVAAIVTWVLFEGRCVNCEKTNEEPSVDHHVPSALGAALTADNATLLCLMCNSRKAASIPAEFYPKDRLDWIAKRLLLAARLTPVLESWWREKPALEHRKKIEFVVEAVRGVLTESGWRVGSDV